MARAQLHRRVAQQALTQDRFEFGLMKVVIVGAAVGADGRRARTDHQRLPLRIVEMHAFETGP